MDLNIIPKLPGKFLCIVTLCFHIGITSAQSTEFEKYRLDVIDQNITAMKISGAWSAGSILSGGIGLLSAEEDKWKAFHYTNIFFGAFNSVVVYNGIRQLRDSGKSSKSFHDSVMEMHKIERLYVFNNGFNFAFILGGLYLEERAKNMMDIKKSEYFTGIGKAIVMQGIFFLVLDTTMFLVQKKHNDFINSKYLPDAIGMSNMQISLSWTLK